MPWTPRQTRFLLSKGSPLRPAQKTKMKAELHADPALAHARKGSSELRGARYETNSYDFHRKNPKRSKTGVVK